MIPRFRPVLGWDELKAAFSFPGADDVSSFERAFADEMGQHHAIAFPYGRTAIVELLKALGLKNRNVICPAYTCVVVPHAIVTSGNKPCFIDSGADGNMDLDLVEKAIDENTGAIVATSIFGQPVNLEQLDRLKTRYPHIPVIQDCAHSFSAEWCGRPVQREGIAAVFGLNVSKIMMSIFGGMLTTDDDVLAKRLRELRDKDLVDAGFKKSFWRIVYLFASYVGFSKYGYALVNKLESLGLLNRLVRYYDEASIDMPADYLQKMVPCEARVGIVQLHRYQGMIAARRQYAEYYRQHLSQLTGLVFLPAVSGATYSQIVARVADRASVMSAATARGVQLGEVLEYSIPQMPVYAEMCAGSGSWPVAAGFSRQIINLPVAGIFEESRAARVVDVIKDILCTAVPPEELR